MDRPILAVSLLLAGWQAGRAQTADLRPEFDVASVKPSDVVSQLMLVRDGKIRLGMHGGPGTDQPHRLTGNAVKLADLIVRAYSIQAQQPAVARLAMLRHCRSSAGRCPQRTTRPDVAKIARGAFQVDAAQGNQGTVGISFDDWQSRTQTDRIRGGRSAAR